MLDTRTPTHAVNLHKDETAQEEDEGKKRIGEMITKSKVKHGGSRIEKMRLRRGAMDDTRLARQQSLWNGTKERKANVNGEKIMSIHF